MSDEEHIKKVLCLFFENHRVEEESINFLSEVINHDGRGLFFISSTYGGLLPYGGSNPPIVSKKNDLLVNNFCNMETVENHLDLPSFYDKWEFEKTKHHEHGLSIQNLEVLWMLWILTLTANMRRDLDFVSCRFRDGFEYFWEVAKYFGVQNNTTGLMILASNCYMMPTVALANIIRPNINTNSQPHMVVNLNNLTPDEMYNTVKAMDTKTPVFVIASNSLLEENQTVKKIIMSNNRPNIRVFKSSCNTLNVGVRICVNEPRMKTFNKLSGFIDVTKKFQSKGFEMIPMIVMEGSAKSPLIKEARVYDLCDAINIFLVGSQFPYNGYAGYSLNEHIKYLMESFHNVTSKFNRILIKKK